VALPPDCDEPVRNFGCYTDELVEMAEYLKTHGVTTVAMESTGVYWVPVYQVLERAGLEVLLVCAQHLKNVPGRKTDVLDCQWLQYLHQCGLLTGSFRPEDAMCVVRTYQRQRETLVEEASRHILRMQKALEQMNVQLHKAISNIVGVTGLRIIRAIVSGERDTAKLAAMRHPGCRRDANEIARALKGDWRVEHLFCLEQELEMYDLLQHKIEACEAAALEALQALAPKAKDEDLPAAKNSSHARKALRPELFVITGVDLTAVDGLAANVIRTIISETGLDMSKWPTAKHFASWLRLAPRRDITGGKPLRRRALPSKNRAAEAFRQAAQTLQNTQTALGAFYRRIRARKGPLAAVCATAHKLAKVFYSMLRFGQPYADIGVKETDERYKRTQIRNALRKLKALGVEIPQFQGSPSVS
jgi:transposase